MQPIVDTDTGRVAGHEALLRGPEGTTAALFAAAARLDHQVILEANARQLAIGRFPDLPPRQRLFVNIDAMVYDMPAAPGHPAILAHQIVLEISERQPIVDKPALWAQVRAWGEAGFAIALDDYGTGFMGLGALLTLRPDFLKLDRVIVESVERDPVHRAAVKNMVALGRDLEISVIAEGVETLDEFGELRACGFRYMQGFLMGRPQGELVAGTGTTAAPPAVLASGRWGCALTERPGNTRSHAGDGTRLIPLCNRDPLMGRGSSPAAPPPQD